MSFSMFFAKTPAAVATTCLLVGMTAFAQPQTPPQAPQQIQPLAQPQAPAVPPGARAPDAAPANPGLRAPAPKPPAPGVGNRVPETTIEGRVDTLLVNPNGEVDGLLLEDGTQVNFPPHLSASLLGAVKAKDSVQVTGRRGENARVLRASVIKSNSTGRSVVDQPPEPGATPPAPRAPTALTAMNTSGRVATLLYTGRGDVKGALLQDGSAVRFPPHVASRLADTLKPGATLYARGYGSQSPLGKTLEATAIGSSADTARDVFAGPAAGGPGAPGTARVPAVIPAPPAGLAR